MISSRVTSFATLAALSLAACGPSSEHARADSAQVALSAQRTQLATQLAAQKDSLTRLVLQADDFIIHIDSSVSKVKGLPKDKRSTRQLDPLARQIENRTLVMARVDALVDRARATAARLAKADKSNSALRSQVASDSAMISDLNTTIKRQKAAIEALSARIDSLKNTTEQLASSLATTKSSLATTESSLATVEAEHNKAFYIVGNEDELVKRGVVVREGGANLLFAHPGRTLQIARTLDPQLFKAIDQRGVQVIAMPDTTRRYRIVSRQNLDYAAVEDRDQNSFRGNLKIADAWRFWAPSRYLVVVEQ